MKIRKLQLKNIGVFDDETIEFQPCPTKDKAEIHIFTGQNGSGKTTILQALVSSFKFMPNSHKKDLSYEERKLIREISKFEKDKKISRALDNFLINFTHNFVEKSNENSSPNTSDFFKKLKEELTNENYGDNGSLARVFMDDGLMAEIYGCESCKAVHADTWGEIHQYNRIICSADVSNFEFDFAVFVFSGYRQIESETVQANYLPKKFNPLSQSLDFIKDYQREDELTVNQLVANNISNRALSKEDGSLEEAKKYETVINSIETFIKDVTDYEVKFVLKRSPNDLKLKMHDEELDFDVLPDGLRSLISWIADLLGRVDMLNWQDDLPINEKNLILLLDEIEVHLHPEWQRKVLPVVQKLFKNSQIFVSTHSPFVVNSVDDAWVYELELKDGKAKVREKSLTNTAYSIQTVLREVFEIDERFGVGTQEKLVGFLHKSREIQNKNGTSGINKEDFLNLAIDLAERSSELQSIVFVELAKISQKTGEPYEI